MIFVGGGCDYNEDNFDGLHEGTFTPDIKTLEITLTDADYKAVADNSANKALAGDADKDALKALTNNKYFTPTISASKYLPAFLDKTYPTADVSSSVKVTYNTAVDLPAEVEALQTATEYQLKADDYKAAWEDGTVKFFTPSKPAADYLPGILSGAIQDPAEGDMAMVTYTYYNGEPESDAAPAMLSVAPATRADAATVTPIKDLTLDGNTVFTAEATVIATYGRGLLVSDESGTILVYTGSIPAYALGDKIRITGTTRNNYNVPQFNNTDLKLEMVAPRAAEFAYPADATTVTAANIPAKFPAAADDATAYDPFAYITFTGTVTSSNGFYNVQIDGAPADAVTASFTNPFEALELAKLVGKKVDVSGYLISINTKNKYFGIATTSLAETGSAAYTPLGVAASKAGTYTSKGVVVATYNKGYLLNDGTATMTVYENKPSTMALGDIVEVSGETEIRYSMSQFKSTATSTKLGAVADVATVRPAETVMTGADMDAYLSQPCYNYVKYSGTLTLTSNNGNTYYEVHNIEGAATAYGSLSYPLDDQVNTLQKLDGKNVIVTGYLAGSNTKNGYATTILLTVESATSYDTETRNAIYMFNGGKWVPSDALALQPADYKAMGLQNGYFASGQPASYLPKFLSTNYPYAQPDDKFFVSYRYQDGLGADEYVFDGAQWTRNNGIIEQTDQFVKNSTGWVWDPSVTIILTPGKGIELSAKYFQACVDWVKENVENGEKYITTYGNNDYYSGASAYQNNLDWRVAEARAQYPEGYAGMSDDEVTEALKQHTIQVFAGVLEKLHPEAKVIEGVDVTYTIQLGIYTGTSVSAPTHKLVYKVTGNPAFEFVSFEAL